MENPWGVRSCFLVPKWSFFGCPFLTHSQVAMKDLNSPVVCWLLSSHLTWWKPGLQRFSSFDSGQNTEKKGSYQGNLSMFMREELCSVKAIGLKPIWKKAFHCSCLIRTRVSPKWVDIQDSWGGDQVCAYHPSSTAMTPPKTGFMSESTASQGVETIADMMGNHSLLVSLISFIEILFSPSGGANMLSHANGKKHYQD